MLLYLAWLSALCELKLLEMTSRLNSDLEPGDGLVGAMDLESGTGLQCPHLENGVRPDDLVQMLRFQYFVG